MPEAYLRASGSRRVPRWQIVPLVGLTALLLVFSPRALGERQHSLLGDSKIEARHVALPSGSVEAFRVHAHASGRAATLLVFVDAHSSAAKLVVGLYRDAHRHPSKLLGAGSVESPTAGAWNAVKLVRAPRLRAGRSYWLTLLGEGGSLRYRARSGGHCLGIRSLNAHFSLLPESWSAGRAVRHAHCPVSAYALARSFSSAAPFIPAPGSPGQGGAPVNLTPPTITVQGGEGSGSPQAFLPFLPPAEQIPIEEKPAEEKPQEKPRETPEEGTKEKTEEGSKEKGKEEKGKEENPGKEGPPKEEPLEKEEPVEEKPKEVAPHNSVVPSIGGTLTVGDALTATTGTWSGSPTSYGYQWQDCDASGENCANTSGAKATTYTLQRSDVGHTMRVVVTATNAGGSTSAASAVTGVVAAYSSGPPYPTCTQTISQGANVASTVSSAAAGSVICLNSGAYGNLTLNASHSSDVTLQAAPQAHVTTGKVVLEGSHTALRGLWIDGEVALEEGASYMTIDRNDITGGGEGIVFDTSDCTAPNAPTWEGCEPHKPISDVTISSNHIHNIGENGTEDAIHLDNWRNVSVVGNEFDHINESGNHTDCLQSVYGGEGLVFDHNYEHDNDCQGIFIKDGDATNVSFTDNLFLRDQEGSYANFAQVWNVKGLVIQHNTIWDGKGFALVANGASFTPTATIDHNVINIFKVEKPVGTPFSITEGEDIFGEAPTNMSEGAGDSVVSSPKFANTTTDDYRLASNPDGIGVDWAPSEEDYGPAS